MISIGIEETNCQHSFSPGRRLETQLVFVFFGLGMIEFVAVHLALSSAPAAVRIIHAIISLSFLVFLVAGLLSFRFNPINANDEGLRIPIGLFRHHMLPYSAMRATEGGAAKDSARTIHAFAILSEPNMFIETHEQTVPSVFGQPRTVARIAISVDNPDELSRILRDRMALQPAAQSNS